MKLRVCFVIVSLLSAWLCTTLAQTATNGPGSVSAQVPPLIRFAGVANDESGKPITGVVGITFSLYQGQQGGTPLWFETQNVQPDSGGRYSVRLGSTLPNGLPTDLFTSGEAQWLGVQISGQTEQPRVLLLSVPYALKALDAETVGGKPASSFVLAPSVGLAASQTPGNSGSDRALPSIGGSGKPGYLAAWATKTSLDASPMFVGSKGEIALDVDNSTVGLNISQKGSGHAIQGTSTSGVAVLGNSTSGVGIEGDSTSSEGVFGTSATTKDGDGAILGKSSGASGDTTAVQGFNDSPAGAGMYGVGVTGSGEGGTVTTRPIGVWGDSGEAGGAGLVGTADQGIAVAGYSNYGSIATAAFQNDESTRIDGAVVVAHGSHYGGTCLMDVSGNLLCNGSKSAVVPVDGGARKVALYAVEAPENWFEDFGSGQLVNGSARVELESIFAQTVDTELDYHVFLTPNGESKGLYVKQKTATSFEVRENEGGTSNLAFDYRIVARRRGYENIRLADKTAQFENVGLPRSRKSTGPRPVSAALRGK